MKTCDLIVVGGGPAGYNCAEYAARNGLRTALIEKKALGGTCLNEGCIPTKSLLYAAKLYRHAGQEAADFGVHAQPASFSHEQAVERKDAVVKTLVSGVAAQLKKAGVDVVSGEAAIEKTSGGFTVSAGAEELSARNLILATGSAPSIPPIEGVRGGLEKGYVLTSTGMLALKELPRELVIVGGGVIGFEMAAYFLNAGSHVTVIEMLDKVLGPSDAEVSRMLQREMEKRGMEVRLRAGVTRITEREVQFTQDGKSCAAGFDKVLLCVGRKPECAVAGLSGTGVRLERGAVVTDDRCRTNIAGMYAVGDVNGKYMLAHVGYREGEVAVNDILGRPDFMDYSAVPSVVYTSPEAAFAGLSEEQAKAAGIGYVVKKAPINFSGRHVVENGLSAGLCKLLIDPKRDVIIGAAALSSYASEYIYALSLMIQNKLPVSGIRRTIFPHPTVCEIIREALMQE